MKIIVAMSGASGSVLGVELLKALKSYPQCETHLIVSEGAKTTLAYETGYSVEEVTSLADYCYDTKNIAAPISSGSFKTDGIIVIPCSMKTLAGIAHGYADNLIIRAVDVCIKENRRVVLVPREAPLSKIHIKNLLEASDCGCTIIPPVMTFYNHPQTIQDQIDHLIGKILLHFGIDYRLFKPWKGEMR